MRVVVALALVLAAGCKDDRTQGPRTPTALPAGDAQLAAVDATAVGPILDLVSCSPAPMPPGEPYPDIGRGHNLRNQGKGAVDAKGGVGTFARVTLGATTEAGLKGAGDVLRKHSNRLRYCYEQNLYRVPTLTGTSKLSIIVKDNGFPHEVIVDDSIDNELSLCLKHIVMELQFPAPKRAPVTIVQPLAFAWTPGTQGEGVMPVRWIPYARTTTLTPSEHAIVAAVAVQKAMPTAKVGACLGPAHTGSTRAIVRVGKDGTVFDANVGGFGDFNAEYCMQTAIIGTKTEPLPATAEVACDFVRGDPAPWRVDPRAYNPRVAPGDTDDGEDGAGGLDIDPLEQTQLVLIEPGMTPQAIRQQLTAAVRGAAYVVALKDDDKKKPLFLLAGRGYGIIPDPAAPMTLDAREPLEVCNGLLTEPTSAPFAEAEKLLASAARRCTKKPCPTLLTISLAAERTGDQLATLVAAARRAGFERIRFGDGVCPR